jgi:hypothetical protein
MWAMEHQSEEEAIKWEQKLNSPLPGHGSSTDTDELDANEIDQLKNL